MGNVLTRGQVNFADLSKPQSFKNASWVISLEVGEHILPKYEDTFVRNLVKHAKNGVILSWAVLGQGGQDHVNCKSNHQVVDLFRLHAFAIDFYATEMLRQSSGFLCCDWFPDSILVFRRRRA